MKKATVLKLHFGLLLFLFSNLALQGTFNLGFDSGLIFWVKMIMYLAAIALFFFSWKERRLVKYYAGIYVFAPVAVVVGYLLDGMLGAILGSFYLFFLYPPETVFTREPYEVKAVFGGFMGRCCPFSLYENKYFLFEKWHAGFEAQNPTQKFTKLEKNNSNQAALYFLEESGKPDTVVVTLKK